MFCLLFIFLFVSLYLSTAWWIKLIIITSCARGRHNMPPPLYAARCGQHALRLRRPAALLPVVVGTMIFTIYATDRRQTDVRRASSLNASALSGRRRNKVQDITAPLSVWNDRCFARENSIPTVPQRIYFRNGSLLPELFSFKNCYCCCCCCW